MKRIFLFLITNLAVGVVLSITVSIAIALLGVRAGPNPVALAIMAVLMGFGGSFISLLLSKTMAKMSVGAQVIEAPASADEQWLVGTVQKLAQTAGIGMP